MKKQITLAMAALMMLTLFAGCNQPPAETSSTASQVAPANSLEAIKARGVLILGTSPDFAPYEFEDLTKTGQDAIVGSDIELAKYIAEKLGVKLEIQAMDFGTIPAAVQNGTVDIGISGFAWTQDRADTMDLSDHFNVKGGYQGLMIRKADVDKFKNLEDFKDPAKLKLVAAQNGSLQHTLLTEQIPTAEVQLITSLNEGIAMLMNGKIDAIGMASTTGEQFAKNYPELIMSDFKYDYTSKGSVACMKKGSPELLEEINKHIIEAESSGLYAEWVAKFTILEETASK